MSGLQNMNKIEDISANIINEYYAAMNDVINQVILSETGLQLTNTDGSVDYSNVEKFNLEYELVVTQPSKLFNVIKNETGGYEIQLSIDPNNIKVKKGQQKKEKLYEK